MRLMLMGGVALALTAGSVAAQTAPGPADAAPAPAPAASIGSPHTGDPLESFNRGVFKFSQGLDRAVIRPAALGYKHVLPSPVRTGVRNALNNLDEPDTFANDMLQLHFRKGGMTAVRFVVNSTIGIGGLFDVAGATGLPIHYSDFGQTLGRYGVRPGPYIYIPVLGPSDLRDGAGRIVDSFGSILSVHDFHVPTEARVAVVVVDGLDTRAEYDADITALHRTATDEYASIRSVYQQHRQALVSGDATAIQDLPDFDSPSSDGVPTATAPADASQPAPAPAKPKRHHHFRNPL
jgi:phospholipid-binding lipoprotein MlaA